MIFMIIFFLKWWAIGFSLTFGPSTSHFIGNLQHAFFMKVDTAPFPNTKIPGIVYALYQCMFAAITPALAIGSAAERGRIVPAIIFIFLWSTLVYDPIACWTWNADGWSAKMG